QHAALHQFLNVSSALIRHPANIHMAIHMAIWPVGGVFRHGDPRHKGSASEEWEPRDHGANRMLIQVVHRTLAPRRAGRASLAHFEVALRYVLWIFTGDIKTSSKQQIIERVIAIL